MLETMRGIDAKTMQFFEVLYGSGAESLGGWMFIAAFPGDGQFSASSGPTQRKWFLWPDEAEKVLAHVVRNREKDLYTSPTLFITNTSAKANNAKCGRTVYVDADECHPVNFRVIPTMVIETSSNRYQAFWVIDGSDDAHDPEVLSRYSRRVAHKHLNAGCDPSGFSIGHLYRIPGSHNNKPEVGGHQVRAKVTGRPKTLTDFDQLYAATEPKQRIDVPPVPDRLPSRDEAVREIQDNPVMWSLYHTAGEQGHDTASRSQIMWKFMCELSRLGFNRPTALVLCITAKSNKYRDNSRDGGLEDIWRQLCKAFADPANRPPKTAQEFDQLDQTRTREAVGRVVADHRGNIRGAAPIRGIPQQFVDSDEWDAVPHDTLADRYEKWALDQTDAAVQFHRAAILTVIATICGDFGAPGTRFRMGPLNLWFLILGGTTRSRKTTARHYGLDMLNDLHTEDQEYYYDLGSDITGEGVNIELASRPGRSVLIHRDEFHGMLSEMYKKTYLHGLKERLASLYDGRTQGRLRATGEKKVASARTALNMYMTGVTERVCEELDADDFASGFLNRFLYVHAPAPPWSKESVLIRQKDRGELDTGVDLSSFTSELADIRQYWQRRVPKPGVGKVPILLDEPALKRFNRFAIEASEIAKDHELADILEPAMDRTVKSVLKVIYVLAMCRKSYEAAVPDVLKALSWAEHWVGDLVFVAYNVHATAWSRRMDEVQRALATFEGDAIPYNSLYKKVNKTFTPLAFKEVLEALRNSDMIRMEPRGTTGGVTIRRLQR